MTSRMSSREFNQNAAGAKRAARDGPVYITDRGQPSLVLLTFEDYTELASRQPSIIELLALPIDATDVDLELTANRDIAQPATLE
jgi:prevent-host-death family protein